MQAFNYSESDSRYISDLLISGVDGRYNLSIDNMLELESDLIGRFKEILPEQKGVVVFSIGPESQYADFARTSETLAFPGYDSAVAMEAHEDRSRFIYTVNLDEKKIAHAKRLVIAHKYSPFLVEALGTGIETIDDRLSSTIGQEAGTLSQIAGQHGIKDFSKCMNVTSNITVPGMNSSIRNPYTLISYKAVFEIGNQNNITHLFAYLNQEATQSLGKLGVRFEPLAGQEFHLPNPTKNGEYDEHYIAVCLPYDKGNTEAFTSINPEFPLRKLIANREVPIFEVD